MATVTPFATPKGGFPLQLTTQRDDGDEVSILFPSSAAVEANRTNLVSNSRGRSGWTAGAGVTLTQGVSDVALPPQPQLVTGDLAKIVLTNTANAYLEVANAAANNSVASTRHHIGAWIRCGSSNVGLQARVNLATYDGGAVQTITTGSTFTFAQGQWLFVDGFVNSPGSTVKAGLRVEAVSGTVSDVWHATGFLCEANTDGGWFDGASESAAVWNGTAFASSSTLTVPKSLYTSMQILSAADTLVAAGT